MTWPSYLIPHMLTAGRELRGEVAADTRPKMATDKSRFQAIPLPETKNPSIAELTADIASAPYFRAKGSTWGWGAPKLRLPSTGANVETIAITAPSTALITNPLNLRTRVSILLASRDFNHLSRTRDSFSPLCPARLVLPLVEFARSDASMDTSADWSWVSPASATFGGCPSKESWATDRVGSTECAKVSTNELARPCPLPSATRVRLRRSRVSRSLFKQETSYLRPRADGRLPRWPPARLQALPSQRAC